MYCPKQQPIELCLRVNLSHRARLPVEASLSREEGAEKAVDKTDTLHLDFFPPSLASDGSISEHRDVSSSKFIWRGKKTKAETPAESKESTFDPQSEIFPTGHHQLDRLSVDVELTY